MEEQTVSLETLGGGAAAEMFEEELKNALDNILDPNTEATAVREVVLKVKIKPSEDRDLGHVTIHATSKLAPVKGAKTVFFMGKQGGRSIATEHNPKQQKLAFGDEKANVTSIKKEAK